MAEESKETAASKVAPKKKRASKKKGASKKGAGAKKSTAKKVTKRKALGGTNAKGEKVNLSEFVLSFSEDVKPMQIVQNAETQGIKGLTANYAASIRSKAKDKGTWPTNASNGVPLTSPRAATTVVGAEAEFRRAARAITLNRAQEILNEIAAAYGA